MSKILFFDCLSYYHRNLEEDIVTNQILRFFRFQLILISVLLSSFGLIVGQKILFSELGYLSESMSYSIDKKVDIHNSFDSDDQKDQGIPMTPMDLMDRLRSAGAMNDATNPSDAIDEALSAFNELEYENVPFE